MNKQEPDQQKKHKEKPLSLYPLTMDEALKEVLQFKPPPKSSKKPKPKK